MAKKKAEKVSEVTFDPFAEILETPPLEGLLRIMPDGKTLEITIRAPIERRPGKTDGVVMLASTGRRFVQIAHQGLPESVEAAVKFAISTRQKKA